MKTSFKTVLVDPPWNERGGGQIKRGADRHYPLMTTPKIIELMRSFLPAIDESAHLWIWATKNHLPDALQVIDALGFTYKSTAVWVKIKDGKKQIGLGQYMRGAFELLLFASRGVAMVPTPENRPSDVILAERTRHSEKPDDAFKLIETVSPAPRLELFARKKRENWFTWGDEV